MKIQVRYELSGGLYPQRVTITVVSEKAFETSQIFKRNFGLSPEICVFRRNEKGEWESGCNGYSVWSHCFRTYTQAREEVNKIINEIKRQYYEYFRERKKWLKNFKEDEETIEI